MEREKERGRVGEERKRERKQEKERKKEIRERKKIHIIEKQKESMKVKLHAQGLWQPTRWYLV